MSKDPIVKVIREDGVEDPTFVHDGAGNLIFAPGLSLKNGEMLEVTVTVTACDDDSTALP